MFYFEVMEQLSRRQVEYLVVGGLSVNLHGVPRVTQDIDLIISMERSNVLKAVSAMHDLGFAPRLPVPPEDLADVEKVKDWVENKNLKAFSFYHKNEPFRVVDIVLVHPLNFQDAYNKRTIKKVKEVDISLVSLEDLITMKEFSARDQDLSDVEMLKKVSRLAGESRE